MVEPVSLQTSFAQTVAAEKVTQVQSQHGESNQQIFAAELAKQDDHRAHEVQKRDKSEEDHRIDEHEERNKQARDDEAGSQEEQADESLNEEMFASIEAEHLIDITV
ncbi:MAG: hypothetical protein JW759_08440 [Candidatus Coatesbacteria bacterium]|nr:hypothetical protein [Candidatus Coatesbacteria bacterium]